MSFSHTVHEVDDRILDGYLCKVGVVGGLMWGRLLSSCPLELRVEWVWWGTICQGLGHPRGMAQITGTEQAGEEQEVGDFS